MFGGSSAPPMPAPQPVTPVPQEDDPDSVEAQRKVALVAKKRQGVSAHLLSGPEGDESDPETQKKRLVPRSTLIG